MDARAAAARARRGLARITAANRGSARGPIENSHFPATASRPWAEGFLLLAPSKTVRRSPRAERNGLHRNLACGIARTPGRPEHAAESQLFAASAVPSSIRAPDFLRPRSERDLLLDDQ